MPVLRSLSEAGEVSVRSYYLFIKRKSTSSALNSQAELVCRRCVQAFSFATTKALQLVLRSDSVWIARPQASPSHLIIA